MAIALGLLTPPQAVDLRAQDYEMAAEIIRSRGLGKGAGEDDDGRVCAGGALLRAVVDSRGNDPGETRYSIDGRAIAEDMELDEPVVQLWNDRPERTQEEVIERLEFAAKKLRNEGRS
jgi:hypothetical protein